MKHHGGREDAEPQEDAEHGQGDEEEEEEGEEEDVPEQNGPNKSNPARKKRKKAITKRVRSHSNPHTPSRSVPVDPEHVDWRSVFPVWTEGVSKVEIADIGCGFGGLVRALGPMFPDMYVLGMEIRPAAVDYVKLNLAKWRQTEAGLDRVGVLTVNCMKNLPNYFRKGQLQRMYFLYADPHFKKSKWDRRIINIDLLDVYAYFLAVGGTLYTATDVEDLHNWEADALDRHPLFRRASSEEIDQDPTVPFMLTCTNDAQKAKREGRGQWYTVHKRIDPRLVSLK